MSKRYQVFVSSTYADLKEERHSVIQALMEMDYIPAGMELFPAIDEEQWEFIKRVIDDSDYYILIIGGRYGSLTSEGISYTEKEFNYAVEKGVKVLVFIHDAPDEIPVGKTDKNPEFQEKLGIFIERAKTGRLVKFWKKSSELPGLVALNLPKTIKMFPAVGWIRANLPASGEFLHEMNELRKENVRLQKLLELTQKSVAMSEDIADFDSLYEIKITPKVHSSKSSSTEWKFGKPIYQKRSWRSLYSLVALYIYTNHPTDSVVKKRLETAITEETENSSVIACSLDRKDFETIKLQFLAYGLIEIKQRIEEKRDYRDQTTKQTRVCWELTEKGEAIMYESGVVKNE